MTSIATLLGLAWQHHQAGALAEAEQLYRQIVAVDPQQADVWHLLGAAVHQQGRHLEAIPLIGRSIELTPANPTFYFRHLGAAQGSAGLLDDAVRSFRQALAIAPNDAQAWFNLGAALGQLGRADEAIASYERSIQNKPDFVQPWFNLGNLLRDTGRTAEALHAYRQAVLYKPDYAEAHNNLGTLLHREGRLDEADVALQIAVRIDPRYARAKNNLGVLRTEQRRLDEAIALFHQALAAGGDLDEPYNNLGVALIHKGELTAALEWIERALAHAPGSPEAHKNRAIVWLFQGDFERGWPEFEWRWRSKDYPRNPYPEPYWNGTNLPEGTLLLHAEQGLGDTVQFMRFVAAARERAARVIVVAPAQIVPLLTRCGQIAEVLPQGAALPAVDAQASLMSLPGLLSIAAADYAHSVPYLKPVPELVQKWRGELAGYEGLRIGITWQGNPQYRGDPFRSVALEKLLPLAAVPGATYFSLQKGPAGEQIVPLAGRLNVIDLAPRLDQTEGAFMDTAALMANLDLVISTDTAAAHLAGALGVPVWVALAHVPEWRWLLARDDTPWYPSMRLFRQAAPGDWPSVFERMAAELRALAARGTKRGSP